MECTRDTLMLAMCYLLDMFSLKVRNKHAQVKTSIRTDSMSNH